MCKLANHTNVDKFSYVLFIVYLPTLASRSVYVDTPIIPYIVTVFMEGIFIKYKHKIKLRCFHV